MVIAFGHDDEGNSVSDDDDPAVMIMTEDSSISLTKTGTTNVVESDDDVAITV